jgi:hypothetical protein
MKEVVALALPMHLIQGLRLAHAIMESEFVVSIDSADVPKFIYLQQFFDLQFKIDVENAPVLFGVTLSHREPLTTVGTVCRPLVFPRAVLERCRAKWRPRRTRRFTFTGLVNTERHRVLGDWIARARGAHTPYLDWNHPFFDEALGIYINCTDTGRRFPQKVWDDAYYEMLGTSEFVPCPKGDCVWSYRFFEAILCGAIPVVEEACPAFDGFRFATMGDDLRALQWSAGVAEHNFNRATDRLTIPRADLDGALRAELSRSRSGEDALAAQQNAWHQLSIAQQQVRELAPAGDAVILVDQDVWRGAEIELGRRIIPFPERDGRYGGPPADDHAAIAELERLRKDGTAFIVFVADCFWWLDYYVEFHRYLRAQFHCIIEDERLVVFALRQHVVKQR